MVNGSLHPCFIQEQFFLVSVTLPVDFCGSGIGLKMKGQWVSILSWPSKYFLVYNEWLFVTDWKSLFSVRIKKQKSVEMDETTQ